jgi:hypothetical protein
VSAVALIATPRPRDLALWVDGFLTTKPCGYGVPAFAGTTVEFLRRSLQNARAETRTPTIGRRTKKFQHMRVSET